MICISKCDSCHLVKTSIHRQRCCYRSQDERNKYNANDHCYMEFKDEFSYINMYAHIYRCVALVVESLCLYSTVFFFGWGVRSFVCLYSVWMDVWYRIWIANLLCTYFTFCVLSTSEFFLTCSLFLVHSLFPFARTLLPFMTDTTALHIGQSMWCERWNKATKSVHRIEEEEKKARISAHNGLKFTRIEKVFGLLSNINLIRNLVSFRIFFGITFVRTHTHTQTRLFMIIFLLFCLFVSSCTLYFYLPRFFFSTFFESDTFICIFMYFQRFSFDRSDICFLFGMFVIVQLTPYFKYFKQFETYRQLSHTKTQNKNKERKIRLKNTNSKSVFHFNLQINIDNNKKLRTLTRYEIF